MEIKLIDILLVEDNPDDIELTLRVFEKINVKNRIHIVRDGQEALDYMHRRGEYVDKDKAPTPGLILLDIKLPKVDGIAVLKQLKSDPAFRRIPIVMLTISQRGADINGSYNAYANSYIVKPVTFDKFVETMRNIKLYWMLTNTSPVAEGKEV